MLDTDGSVRGYVVLDVDLPATLSDLTGDSKRNYVEPGFKTIYTLIVQMVSLVLQKAVTQQDAKLIAFSVVIYLTLAIFDLGKTTLEEEVLLYKDILKHSSTRGTITRFIAAIIIALSIEALQMIFKARRRAVYRRSGVGGSGSRAEVLLVGHKQRARKG